MQNGGNNPYAVNGGNGGNSNPHSNDSALPQMYGQQQPQHQGQSQNGKSQSGYGSSWNMNALDKVKGGNGGHQWLLNPLRDFSGNMANNDCLGKSSREHTNNSDK